MREFQDPSLFLLATADFVFDFDRRACDDLLAVLQSTSYWTLTAARFTSLVIVGWKYVSPVIPGAQTGLDTKCGW